MDVEATSLADVGSAPLTVTFGTIEYAIAPVQVGHIANAIQYIRERRIEAAMKPFPMASNELKAQIACEIASKPLYLSDVMSEWDGECMMLAQGLWIDGKSIGLPHVLNKLKADDRDAVRGILLYLGGIYDHPFEPTNASPDETKIGSGHTSTPEDLKTGEPTSSCSVGTEDTPRTSS